MRKALLGGSASDECICSLERMGIEAIKLPSFSLLQPQVSDHADMLCFFYDKKLLMHRDYYNENKGLFDSLGINIILSDELIGSDYPYDVLFNAVLTDKGILFSNTDHTSALIRKMAEKTVRVKQGYTACSTCRVDAFSFITADNGLYKAYISNGIDCLLISQGEIAIKGYDHGFIGGASFTFDDKVCFFGDVTKHSDYSKIKEFVENRGKTVVCLSDEPLCDVGGGIMLGV